MVSPSSPTAIFVIGSPGTGKTTIAHRIAEKTVLPLYHLDDIARVGGANGQQRPMSARANDIDRILATRRWVVEGAHTGWTEPLLAGADTILWLDHIGWGRSSLFIVRRFVRNAWAEVGRQRGLRRFTRFHDYATNLRHLLGAVGAGRHYKGASVTLDDSKLTQASLAAYLTTYESKLVRCRTAADIDSFIARIRATPASDPVPTTLPDAARRPPNPA